MFFLNTHFTDALTPEFSAKNDLFDSGLHLQNVLKTRRFYSIILFNFEKKNNTYVPLKFNV